MIEGDELPEAIARHVDECSECRFLRSLSRAVGSRTPAGPTGGIGAAARAMFAAAIESREPILGRYRIEELRGRGGQGEVYRATDLETDDVIALKLTRAIGLAVETSNARRVHHPNVCRVFHVERHGDLRLAIMEYAGDGTLADRIGKLSPATALAMFRGVCSGVQACHDAGVLHLDLKPSNVLLRGDTPLVTDFGLSQRLDSTPTATGGTPRYMAPEQLAGGIVDRRTDVYALGKLLADLTDRHPKIVARAAARDPAARYADAVALVAALDAPARRRRRLRWLAVIPALAALLVGVLPFVLPPPTGPRATWKPEVWGADTIPADAWNVARNTTGSGLPRIEVSHRLHGCGQRPYELLDGRADYASWEHGVAFTPAPSSESPAYTCIPLTWLAACGGELRPDDRLCRETKVQEPVAENTFEVLELHGRDVDRLPRDGLGLAHPHEPCGERRVTVNLDGAHTVIAVRAWFHGRMMIPRTYRIEVEDGETTTAVFVTTENFLSRLPAMEPPPRVGVHAGSPVTAEFTPVRARRVHLVMNTCTSLEAPELERYRRDPLGSGLRPGNGWLYELEVFATVSRHAAWWRRVFDD